MSHELDPNIEFKDPLRQTRANRQWLRSTTLDPAMPDIAASIVVFEYAGEIKKASLLDDSEITPDQFDRIRQQHPHLR